MYLRLLSDMLHRTVVRSYTFIIIIFLACFAELYFAQAEFVALTCVSCPAGQYLDQETNNCTQCPLGSSTFEYTNASNISHCLCEPGFQSVDESCVHCAIGFHKYELGNVSCKDVYRIPRPQELGLTM